MLKILCTDQWQFRWLWCFFFSKWLQGIFLRWQGKKISTLSLRCIFVHSRLVFQLFSLFVILDLLMTEVVECFVVCHWAVSCNKLTERHVSRAAINVIEVIRDGLCQPRELYESLIETFSKEGDLILDIGSANGKLIISLSFSMKRWFTCICDPWPRFPMLQTFSFFLGRKGWGTWDAFQYLFADWWSILLTLSF